MFLPKIMGKNAKIKLLLIIAVFVSVCAHTQSDQSINSVIAEQYITAAKYDSAIILFNSISQEAENNENWEVFIHSYLRLANIYKILGQYNKVDSCILILESHSEFKISDYKDPNAERLHQKGTALGDRGEYKQAIALLEEVIEIRTALNGPQDTLMSKSFNNMGTYYYYLGDLKKANQYYEWALELAMLSESQKGDIAMYLQNIGIIYARLGDFEKTLEYFKRNLEINSETLNEDDPAIAQIYLNLGQFYSILSRFDESIKYFDLAEEIYIKVFGVEYISLGTIYLNKGSIYVQISDTEEAEKYLKNALNIYTQLLNPDHPNIARIYNNLGFVYLTKKDYDQAKEFFQRSLDIQNDPSSQSMLLLNLATVYAENNDFLKAQSYIEQSIDKAKNELGDTHYQYGNALEFYGQFLLDQHELELAEGYIIEALRVHKLNFDIKNSDVSDVYNLYGDYHAKSKDYLSALKYYQQSMIANDYSFSDTNIFSNPENLNPISESTLLNTLLNKASSFSNLYKYNESIIYLEASLLCYEDAMEVFDRLKSRLKTDSKFILTDESKNQFDKAYDTYFTHYDLTKDKNLLNNSFRFAEKNKAAVLLSSMQDINAMEFGGIPTEQLSLEKDLKERINGYEQLIYDQINLIKPDSSKIVLWERRLFDLTNKYNSLIEFFGNSYPAYFELKYDFDVSNLDYIQSQLKANQAIIEYTLVDSAIYTYLITADVSKLVRTFIDATFYENLRIVQRSVNLDFANHTLQDFSKYVRASNKLYEVLLSDFINEITDKKLIIIPDGILGYLAFEALIIELPDDLSRINYRSLSYLIKEFPISYSYSSTLLFKNQNSKSSGNSVLAFAPSYQVKNLKSEDYTYDRNTAAKLKPLFNAQQEVANINKIFKGRVFANDLASEENFKANSSDYDVLHFAMHTLLDDEDPMHSKMVFTQGLDSIEDGFLNTYEIYNLNLKAQLAVLSACNTGSGKIINGEGIMSLARGFIYAGVPSIIMTLWEIDDKSGADIMTGFYKKLKDGLDKDIALQVSKLDYLSTASQLRAHPYFWSAYVNIGNTSPLKNNRTGNLIFAIPLFIFIIIILIIKKKKLPRRIKVVD